MAHINRQLEEILSWRFITEFWRRFPQRFSLIEAHPGGGMYDCLVLITKGRHPQFAIDVNRDGGSVHVHKGAFGLPGAMRLHSDWLERMLHPPATEFLDEVAREANLTPPSKLPPSTTETLVYRFISNFLTHSLGGLAKWECRNGYDDTSGYGGGKREKLFEKFPHLAESDDLRKAPPICGERAYGYWFLIKDGDPLLCLCVNGEAHRRDGIIFNLADLYKSKRRIWPMIFKVASDILP